SDAVELDKQVSRAAEDIATPVLWRINHELRVLDAAKESFQREVHLQARERAAEAGVDAAAPAEVLVVRAFGIEFVRVKESQRVAVRGAVHELNRRTLRDDCPTDFDVGGSAPAGKKLDRRLEAQNLLDGAGN